MKLLLDTHLLLWAAAQPEKLSEDALALIGSTENQLLFSAASLWEIAIKASLGREDFTVDPSLIRRGLLDNGYTEMPVNSAHAVALTGLPPLHKDPFDRILVAQAHVEGVVLVTSDGTVSQYPGAITRV